METWDAIRSRRNVRSYGGPAIAPQDLDRILEAGRRSPSAGNQQAWDFVSRPRAARRRRRAAAPSGHLKATLRPAPHHVRMQTFLVRVWIPAAAEEDDERRPLRGVVEHVASRRGATFHGELDLLDFIRGCLQAPPEVLPAVVDEV